MSSEVEVVNRLLLKIAPEAEISNLDPDALLQEQIDIDSLDFMQLVTGISDETLIEVPERDYPRLATLNGMYTYIKTHRPED